MIASIAGTVSEKMADTVLIEVGGLGYEVFLTAADWGSAKLGASERYYVYQQVREDANNLYGFKDLEAKQVFTSLISISGIGPKVGLAILSASSIDRLKQAITAGDPDLLKGVSGVGKKTAERIIIELAGKFGPGAPTSSGVATDSAYQALIGLGYSSGQAAQAVAALPADLVGDQARIKAALRGLSS